MAKDSAVMDNETVNDTAPESEESKRERVDLATLAPHDKVTITLSVPVEFKRMVNAKADESDQSAAEYLRDLSVKHFNYELPKSFVEVKRGRTSVKYAGMTAEEKKEAIKKENDTKRKNMARIMELIAAGQLDASALGLEV